MNKVITRALLALVGLMMFATTAVAQSAPPPGTPYITMAVTDDATVQIDLKAAAANTPVWVETAAGSYTQVTVGTSWTGFVNYTANGFIIKVHGNLAGFDCSGNTSKLLCLAFSSGLTNLQRLFCQNNSLMTLDVSRLTNLRRLYCQNNDFSTQAIDGIYCSLPQRQTGDDAVIEPVYSSSSADIATVLATNTQNAIDKNWKVQYYDNDADLPATTGTYVCPPTTPPSGTPYITMTVPDNAYVKFQMKAAAANTLVWVETEAGSYIPVVVDTVLTRNVRYLANGTTVKVHGNLKEFISQFNREMLTGLTFSSGLTNLEYLACPFNSLTTLDVSGLTNLKELVSTGNSLTTLDVSGLTNLKILGCGINSLTTLDVSGLTNLQELYCQGNSLTTLDVSGLTNLKKLVCASNNFTTQAIDDIYCGLPQRTAADSAVINPVSNSSSADIATVLTTNTQNAIDKNWRVQYYDDDADLPATTGTYVCPPATPPDGTPCITMTVANGATVQIDMKAAAANTPVWVETEAGSYTPVMVGTSWTDFENYTANGTTINVHGNLMGFDCSDNSTNLTGLTFSRGLTNLMQLYCQNNSITTLDVSGLTNLQLLFCHNNNFTTQAIDDIYCGLPQRTAADNAVINPVYNSSSADIATVLATNTQNAIDKNWKVQYSMDNADLPATTGTYVCGTGIDDVAAAEQLSIMPNPAGNTLNIECTEPVQEVRLHNIQGTEVLRTTQSKGIDVSHLSKGVYIVSVRTARGTATQKLIKE